jgi:hypothetical protein
MATPKTMYQRNKGKVDRPMLALQQQFNQARDQYNKDYTSALRDYQNKLSAYEEQSKAYESKFSAYKQRADEYNQAVTKFNTKTRLSGSFGPIFGYDPSYVYFTEYNRAMPSSTRSELQSAGATFYTPSNLKLPSGFEYVPTQYIGAGSFGVIEKRGGPDPGVFKETFNEPAPAAPAEPDTAAAKTKLAEAETTYNREVAERKAGKVRARMRTAQRPMLGGVS